MSPAEEGKLSKEEMDALLQATRQEEPPLERPEQVRRVQGCDFQQPSRFSKSALEKLRRMNDDLAQNATSHAARLLRTNVKTQLVSMDQMKWENLLEEVGDSVVGFLFLMNPLGYRGLISVERQFAVACLEKMMGGPSEAAEPVAEFTELEVRILASFVRAFLSPLPALWERIGQFEVELGPFAQDPQSLDVFPSGEDFFQLCFLMQSSAGAGQIVISVPFAAVQSLPPETEQHQSAAVAEADQAAEAGLRESLKQMTVQLTVLLGSADIKVARLVRVEPGDVIVLGTGIGDPLAVNVNDKVKFRGLPGTSRGKLAVKLIVEE